MFSEPHRLLPKPRSETSGYSRLRANRLLPRAAPCPYLHLIGQALQACRHQQQPPSDLWVARLARELPHCGGPLQVFPHPRLFVEHCKAPTNISPAAETHVTEPGSLLILRFCLPVAWVPKGAGIGGPLWLTTLFRAVGARVTPARGSGAGRAGRLPSLVPARVSISDNANLAGADFLHVRSGHLWCGVRPLKLTRNERRPAQWDVCDSFADGAYDGNRAGKLCCKRRYYLGSRIRSIHEAEEQTF